MGTKCEPAALAGEQRVLARWGGRVKTVGPSEQPVGYACALRGPKPRVLSESLYSLSTRCQPAQPPVHSEPLMGNTVQTAPLPPGKFPIDRRHHNQQSCTLDRSLIDTMY